MRFEIFNNEKLGSVRTIFEETTGEPWFLGTDVAKILGYKRPNEAILDHTSLDDRKALKFKAYAKTPQAELWGKNDFMDKILINESGLYCLIFGSTLEAAKEFKLWVTKEVLPSIRKNGGYIYGQENLSMDEKNALLAKVQKLSKDLNAYKDDGDFWMNMYFNLEKDYLKVVSALNKEDVSSGNISIPEAAPKKESEFVNFNGFIMSRETYLSLDK